MAWRAVTDKPWQLINAHLPKSKRSRKEGISGSAAPAQRPGRFGCEKWDGKQRLCRLFASLGSFLNHKIFLLAVIWWKSQQLSSSASI